MVKRGRAPHDTYTKNVDSHTHNTTHTHSTRAIFKFTFTRIRFFNAYFALADVNVNFPVKSLDWVWQFFFSLTRLDIDLVRFSWQTTEPKRKEQKKNTPKSKKENRFGPFFLAIVMEMANNNNEWSWRFSLFYRTQIRIIRIDFYLAEKPENKNNLACFFTNRNELGTLEYSKYKNMQS